VQIRADAAPQGPLVEVAGLGRTSDNGPPPVPPQDGNTALHLAAAGGHVLAVRELLRAGAEVVRQNKVRLACHTSQ
jgi:hypothetical protein